MAEMMVISVRVSIAAKTDETVEKYASKKFFKSFICLLSERGQPCPRLVNVGGLYCSVRARVPAFRRSRIRPSVIWR